VRRWREKREEEAYCGGVAKVDPIVAAIQAFPNSDPHFDMDRNAAAAAVGIAVVADNTAVAVFGADNYFVAKISAVAAAADATVVDRDIRLHIEMSFVRCPMVVFHVLEAAAIVAVRYCCCCNHPK
jgi:hypothetical protein